MNGPDPNDSTRTAPIEPDALAPASSQPVAPIHPEPAPSLVPEPVTAAPVQVTPVQASAAPEPGAVEPLTPPVYEATVAWAPAEPVIRPTAPRRRGRLRWAFALAVVAIIIGTSAAVAALIVGQSPDAAVLGYVPDNTIAYAEVRLDLPGDQRRAVGEFLSKFPGFQDQAALEGKLDEVLDELVKDATEDKQSYTADIKPWFGGELAVSVGPLPEASKLLEDPDGFKSLRALVLISVTDPAAAQAWFDTAFKDAGATSSTETYGGATLILYGPPDGPKAALAVLDDKVAVVGDETSVKAAIDTNGNSGFSAEPGPKTALDAADRDHVGFVYVALRPLVDWSNDLNKQMSESFGGPVANTFSESMLEYLPAWGAYWLRIENDAVVAEAIMPTPKEGITSTADRTSTVMDHVPATSVAAVVGNDYGKTLEQGLELYRAEPSLKPVVDQIDQALGLLGGTDAALGWIGDLAVVINVADETPEGGVIVLPTDPAKAQSFFTSIKSLVAIGGAQAGATVREETYNGTTITIIDVGNLADLAGRAGVPTGSGLPVGHVEIAFATTDDLVVVGSGPGFVKHVLDTTKATSLGGDDRYRSLAARAGTGSSVVFVDIAAIRGHIEHALPTLDPKAAAEYDKNVKPYLTPFDALIATGSVENDLTQSTFIVTVK